MKKYQLLLVVLILGFLCWPAPPVSAQEGDTLAIEWETSPGSFVPLVNVLRNTIANDTTLEGDRVPNRVYLLRRGGFYWITDRISNEAGFPLVIVGETADVVPQGEIDYGPAIIQRVNREGGGTPDGTMFEAFGDLTLKMLWIMGQTDQGVRSSYEPIKLMGDGKNYIFDNVVFDRNDWHHLGPDGPNNDFFFTNCSFRNLFGPTQMWEGLGIRFEVGADTVIFENNTFFNIGFTPFQSEAQPINYFLVNHNTFVNIGRQFCAGTLWKEIYVVNNVFVNPFWKGESYDMYSDPERDDPYTGFFSISALPAIYGTNYDRQIVLANNSYWRDQDFEDFYVAWVPDPIRPQPLVNDTTQGWFNAWDNMLIQDNYSLNPTLTTYPPQDIIDSMIAHVSDLYTLPDPITPATPYYWDPARDEENYVNSIWPLPEDFSYTNATLLTGATDNLPVGDLNWFPTDKATYLGNRDANIEYIHNMVSAPELYIVETIEAEKCTLAGETQIDTAQGLLYFKMDTGWMEWVFDLTTGGQYDLNILTHMRGNDIRGQRVIVNGVSIHECYGWGEYIWDSVHNGDEPCLNVHDGMPINEWTWTKIIQSEINEAGALTFNAGSNTIRIESSWGWQNFSQIDLLEPGTENVVKSLKATDATYGGVTPSAEGAAWTPSAFFAVALGAGGNISFNVDAPYDAQYMMRIFYAAAGTATGAVAVDAQEVVPVVTFTDTSDVFTDQFPMSAGNRTITVSSAGGGVSLDYLQVIAFVPVSIGKPDNVVDGFSLAQNYPNPFNPVTNINFALGKASDVELVVYNVLGQKVTTLIDQRMNQGAYTVQFDASRFASGVYFYRIKAGDFVSEKKMVLLK